MCLSILTCMGTRSASELLWLAPVSPRMALRPTPFKVGALAIAALSCFGHTIQLCRALLNVDAFRLMACFIFRSFCSLLNRMLLCAIRATHHERGS